MTLAANDLRCSRRAAYVGVERMPRVVVVALLLGACAVAERSPGSSVAHASASVETTARSRWPPPPPPSERPPDRHLIADLVEGVRPAKEEARRACEGLARAGDRPRILLDISGPDGRIREYEIVDDAGNPALARCVAEAVQRGAVFRKVTRASSRLELPVGF